MASDDCWPAEQENVCCKPGVGDSFAPVLQAFIIDFHEVALDVISQPWFTEPTEQAKERLRGIVVMLAQWPFSHGILIS